MGSVSDCPYPTHHTLPPLLPTTPTLCLASVDGSGTRTWEIHDALGSVRQHLAADGSVVPGGSYAYTPFGVVASGTTPDPFGFTGELHSEGLVYLRARWYDPSVGTFTSRDPFAGFPTRPYSLHPYQYGYSNPLLYTDPSGELAIFIHGGFGIVDPEGDRNPYVYQLADHLVKNGALYEDEVRKTGTAGRIYEGIIGGVNDRQRPHVNDLAEEIIQTCGNERIILFGYSRGGVTAQLIAGTVALLRPDIKIDLVVTVAAVEYAHPTNLLPSVRRKGSNVKKHLNFFSGQGVTTHLVDDVKEWPEPLPGPMREMHIDGAVNEISPEDSSPDGMTSHMGIMADKMPLFDTKIWPVLPGPGPSGPPPITHEYVRDVPGINPIWQKTEEAIRGLHLP